MALYESDLRDYIRIFYKRKILIIVSLLLGTVISLVFFPAPPPEYESTTTIKIEQRKTIAGLLTESIIFNPGDLMDSQARIIKGFPIMKKAALHLGMIDDNSPTSVIHRVVSELQDNLVTEQVGQTNIIKIISSAGNAISARDLASTVADIYVKENLLEKTEQARSSRLFIEEQLSLMEGRLKETEEQLKTMEADIDEAAALKADIGRSDPLQEKLIQLKFELTTLEQTYSDKHPRILLLRDQISNLEKKHDDRSKDLYNSDNNFSDTKLEYARLSREVEINKKLYMMFKEKLEEARIKEAEKVGDVSIVNPAILQNAPKNTQGDLNVLIGGFIGFLLGIGIAFILEALDSSIQTAEDMEDVMKLPVLGTLPPAKRDIRKIKIKKKVQMPDAGKQEAEEIYIRMITHHQPTSRVAEACRNIRTSLMLDSAKKTFLVTSVSENEGKTTLMINLGLVVAQTGMKTLLVSSDLRRPSIARTFGTENNPGLTDILAGTASFDEVVRDMSDLILGDMKLDTITESPGLENISILPSGKLLVNPAEVLESEKWTALVQELQKRFDVIFFDSPPLLPVADASIIASKVDSVIICYESGKTPRSKLLRVKMKLESIGARISGIVIYNIKLNSETAELYPYYKTSDKGIRKKPTLSKKDPRPTGI